MPDKFHHVLQQLIAEKKPETIEELQKIMNSLIGKTPDELEFKAETDADKALELVWQARRLPIEKGRRVAQKALKLDPDSIEAYEYIGHTYSYYEKRAIYFGKGAEIGRRRFSGAFMKQHKGHFWMATETRPFMCCLAGLAECYYAQAQVEQAITIWKEMLDLNPNDNQGIRYQLLPALIENKDLDTFTKIRKKYRDDASMMFQYCDALVAFIKNGATPAANRLLRDAMRNNRFVPPMLLAVYPPQEYANGYMLHSREEALVYVHAAWRGWIEWMTPGAKDWLRAEWRKFA